MEIRYYRDTGRLTKWRAEAEAPYNSAFDDTRCIGHTMTFKAWGKTQRSAKRALLKKIAKEQATIERKWAAPVRVEQV